MKVITATMLSLMITGTQALASVEGAGTEGMGLLATFFIAFGVLIVLFQFLPGMALFLGILKGVFSSKAAKSAEAADNNRSSH